MNTVKLITIEGVRLIVNIQYSKIGAGYPRLFIEEVPNEVYVNLDLSIGAAFKMKKEDWNDWLEDAVVADPKEALKEAGVKYGLVLDVVRGINS